MGKNKKEQQLTRVGDVAGRQYQQLYGGQTDLEKEFIPQSQGFWNAYSTARQQQVGDYGDIMGGYKNLFSDLQRTSPTRFSFERVGAERPAELGEGYGYLREAAPGYREFSQTGGYSPTDIQELRARGVSPIRAAYGNTMMELNRARALGGAGGAPNYIAAASRAQREMPGQMADAMTGVNAQLAQDIRSGRLAGLAGLSGIGSTMGGLASSEAGRMLQAALANQGAGLQTQAMNEEALQNLFRNKLGVLGAQTGLYGTTPAMAATFGNQALQAYGQRANLEAMRNQFGLGLLDAQLRAYGSAPQDVPWWQKVLGAAGTAAPYIAMAMQRNRTMPSFLEMLRLKNIFDPNRAMMGNDMPGMGGISGNIPPPTFGGDMTGGTKPSTFSLAEPWEPNLTTQPTMSAKPEYSVADRMKELYTPETAATDRFNNLLASYPERQKPGFWRTVAAILTDLKSGPEMGMTVAEWPYRKKMEDWKAQVGPAQAAAGLERQTNVNERQMAYQTVSQELRQQADEARAANNEEKARIAEMRARIYEYRYMNPNVKFDFSGPTVLVADPASGKVTDTGVQTGNLSRMDILNLQHKGRMAEIGARGDIQQDIEATRQTGMEGRQEASGWGLYYDPGTNQTYWVNSVTKEKQPFMEGRVEKVGTGRVGVQGELPTQTRVRQFNLARQLAAQRPDLAKFIHVGVPGPSDFKIDTPGGWGGPTPEQHEEISQYIYGARQPTISQPSRTGATETPIAQPTPTAQNAPPAPPGWKYVPKPGGGWTAVPVGG